MRPLFVENDDDLLTYGLCSFFLLWVFRWFVPSFVLIFLDCVLSNLGIVYLIASSSVNMK